MVTQVDVISTPPTPADPPAVFEERAAQVWSDLARAVPQMNAQALENNAAADEADQAKNRAITEADLAMGYRNAAQAAALQSSGFASDANAAKLAAEQAQEDAEQAKTDAQQVLSTMQDMLDTAVQSATAAAEEAKDDAEAARNAAQASAAAWAYSMPALVKTDPEAPCIIKTSATTLAIKAGTHVKIGNGYVSFTAQTSVTMPAVLTPGEDYAVFVRPDGTASAVADPFSAPAAAPAPGAVKIGGFHYGAVAPGTTLASGSFNTATRASDDFIWTQNALDLIVGINAHSMWDLQWRPSCDPRGMTCVTGQFGDPIVWVDIYFCGPSHLNDGTSKFGSAVASGTVLPQKAAKRGGGTYGLLSWFVASEIAFDHGKRLLSYEEFAEMAYGVTEAQSLGGAESTIPATARQPGYTSRFGVEQATGHHWSYGNVAHGTGGTEWITGAQRGQTYGTPVRAIFGGARYHAAYSGSRCSNWRNSASSSYWDDGLRAACDPLPLLA